MKRGLILVGVVVALVLAIGITKALQVKKAIAGFAAMPEPSATVSTQKIALADWSAELSAVGSLRAVRGVDVASEVAGLVAGTEVRSGQDVRAGQTLLRLVADSDIARLQSLKAAAELAEINFKRDEQQFAAQAISQAQLDSSALTYRGAQAQYAEQQALVAKKTIRAPFDGRLGISTINPGHYLNAGEKIVTLQQLDPIYVDFSLPQQALTQLATGQKIIARSDSLPDTTFDGEISAIEPVVDADTRNVRVQATIRNPKRHLLPGMFANVAVIVGKPQRYLTLPQTAVTFNPYGETVFVVVKRGEENAPDPGVPAELAKNRALERLDAEQRAADAAKAAEARGEKPKAAAAPAAKPVDANAPPVLVARQVFVKTGPTRGDQVAILEGLKEGDEVVTTGQLKLKNGLRVIVNNSVLPPSDPSPKPQEQ